MSVETIRGTPEQLAKVPVQWVEEGLREAEQEQGFVDVGFFEKAQYQNGTYVATVAAIHNFGASSRNIPARPFFTHTLVQVQKGVEHLFNRVGSVPMKTILGQVGQFVENKLKKNIRNGPWVQNAPSTIKRKTRFAHSGGGSPKPLIDTGYMRQSVTHNVSMGTAR